MEAWVAVPVAIVVGLACPAMMWWRRRRGYAAECCVSPATTDARELTLAKQKADELGARVAALRDAHGE